MIGIIKHRMKTFGIIVILILMVIGLGTLMFLDFNGENGITGWITAIGGGDNAGTETIAGEETADGFQLDPEFSLTLNQVPSIGEEKINADLLKLNFQNSGTTINLNEEELSLSDMSDVVLQIKDFEGTLKLNDDGLLTLDGEGKELVANGVTLSTQRTLDVSFQGLDYDTLVLDNAEISDLYFNDATGQVALNGKLAYQLETEDLSVTGFEGDISVSRGANKEVNMLGQVSKFQLTGAFYLEVE